MIISLEIASKGSSNLNKAYSPNFPLSKSVINGLVQLEGCNHLNTFVNRRFHRFIAS